MTEDYFGVTSYLINRAIDGVSTYNVIPFEAGQYFNKIQCFCFEEQRLNPGEEVRMKVVFGKIYGFCLNKYGMRGWERKKHSG